MCRAQRHQPFIAVVASMASGPHPILYGIPAEAIRDVCAVSLRAAIAYKTGKRQPPATVVRLLELHSQGRILTEAFEGWSVRGAELFDPEGHRTTQSMLRAYAQVWQLARELARQDAAASAELERIASIAVARVRRRRSEQDDFGASVATAETALPTSDPPATADRVADELSSPSAESVPLPFGTLARLHWAR